GAFAGRTLMLVDDEFGAPTVAVLSYRTWQVRFAADPSIIGCQMLIDREPAMVVGVAARSFFGGRVGGDFAEWWVPLASEPKLMLIGFYMNDPDNYWLYVIGRLRSGVIPGRAQARLKSEI